MSTQTPTWQNQHQPSPVNNDEAVDDRSRFPVTVSAIQQKCNHRQISGSLKTSPGTTSGHFQSGYRGDSNHVPQETTNPSSLLTTRTADECSTSDNRSSLQKNNANEVNASEVDYVEQEQAASSDDTVLKYHYQQQPQSALEVINNEVLDGGNSSGGRRYNRISMIIFYGREALCVLALILTTYASIQNSPPRISKAPPPAPFFSRGSLVHDWPSGALGPTQTRVSQSELSFVFYYAPWCAESQHARSVYEHVARLYYREAHFAAINCWQPGGECRLQYSKVQSWPVLMAYQPNGLAVQYHQAWTNAALARFVQSLMTPLHRMAGPGDLMSFMTGKDAVVVAFLDMENDRKQYSRFYQTSLKWLEKDPFQEVSFGVVTGQSIASFGIDVIPTIRLYLWNETIEFHGNDSWTTPELTTWINKHIQVVSVWIAPPGSSKSTSLAPYFKQGPVLFFFTPRSLYAGSSSDAYMMLRQLGMQYYNCPEDIWVQEMARKYIAEQRRASAELYLQFKQECDVILKRHPSQDEESTFGAREGCASGSKSAIAVSFVSVLNSSKFAEGGKPKIRSRGEDSSNDYCEIECDEERFYGCGAIGSNDGSLNLDGTKHCAERKRKYASLYGSMKNDAGKPTVSMLDSDQDYRGPKLLKRQHLRRQCELLKLGELENGEVFFQEPLSQNGGKEVDYLDLVKGLSCKYNKTLTFVGMDSGLYHAFAERLGVDVLREHQQSMAAIVDHEDESTYLLRNDINLKSMAKLVYNFYNRTLTRFRRANNLSFKNTHTFNMSEFRKESQRMVEAKRLEQVEAAQNQKQKKSQPAEQNGSQSGNRGDANKLTDEDAVVQHHYHHALREINSHNFNHVVVNSNKTVIVHFYSAHCAFCSMLSQHLLTISRMLRGQPMLEFVRIDGDRNDLQWEFSMDAFPTLIIFPNHKKSESRVFPRSLQMTVPNVLGFILSNLSSGERLHANYLVCKTVKSSPAFREDCLLAMKRELSDSISLSLRQYRMAMNRPVRAARILQRLQVLQEFYLTTLRCLSHSCDFTQLKSSAKTILTLWQIAV